MLLGALSGALLDGYRGLLDRELGRCDVPKTGERFRSQNQPGVQLGAPKAIVTTTLSSTNGLTLGARTARYGVRSGWC